MKPGLLLVVLLAVFSTPTQQQQLHAQTRLVSRVVLYSGVVTDLASTRYSISKGAHEVGPAGNSVKNQVYVSVGYGVGLDVMASVAERAGHPKIANRFRIVMGGMKLGVSVSNVRVGRNMKPRY